MISKIISFDGTEQVDSIIERPEKYSSLFENLSEGKFIPRGAGLSYCLASAGENVKSVSSILFNRVIFFDKLNGLIRVEAGMNVGDLLNIVISENFILPVLPGYPKITIGGCVAFNVHGKSQSNIGLFGKYVKSLKLFHPTHGEIECNEKTNSEILELTIGGFGLTGFITEVELKLLPLKSRFIIKSKVFVNNLSEAIEVINDNKNEFSSIYSWNNLNLKRSSFGKGLVFFEKEIDGDCNNQKTIKYNNLSSTNRGKFKFSFYNKISVRFECFAFYLNEKISKSDKVHIIENVSFPINGKEIYFNLFGNRGLREYQVIIPLINWVNFEQELYLLIIKIGISITLGSLKLFEGEQNLLSFCKSGICLAIDVPASDKAIVFFNCLDELALKYKGIANISKDSRLSSTVIKQMYPEYSKFVSRLNEFEGNFHLSSNLRNRLF